MVTLQGMVAEAISQTNATTYTPEDIVKQVLAGRVRVPSFQRGLRWRWEDVRRLFDSIVKGYPIGSLLLWERPAEKERIRLGALELDGPSGTSLFVVDGQQRVTSLANALTEEGFRDPKFALAFDLRSNSFVKPSQEEDPHVIPLPVIFDLKKLVTWFTKHPEIMQLLDSASGVTKTIRQYAIPAYVVKQQDEKVLRDIFDRMNSYGRRLSRAEIFSALHSGRASDGSGVKVSDIAEKVDTQTGFGPVDDDTVLRAILARRGGNVSRDIRIEFSEDASREFAGERPDAAYQEGRRALEQAIRFLQQHAGVPHFSFLPYRYLLVVLTRFFAHFPHPSSRNRTLLRRFFWRAALAGPTIFRAWTEAMRVLATRIAAGDESGSVQRLLEPFEAHAFSLPRLDRFRTHTADTRIILCALWSLGPRSPASGAEYDLDDLASTLSGKASAKEALQTFFPRVPDELRAWTANRAILLDEGSDDASAAILGVLEGAEQFTASTRAKILGSHGLDKAMLMLLQASNTDAFLRARQARLEEVIKDFVTRMAETQFEDTPPLDDMNLDDDERRDDALA